MPEMMPLKRLVLVLEPLSTVSVALPSVTRLELVPFRAVVVWLKLFRSKVAVERTERALFPRTLAAPARRVPALTLVLPEKLFAPEMVRTPVPDLLKVPVPEMTPEKVVLVLLRPTSRFPEFSVTEPAPASEPIVWSKPLRSRMAPAATVVALFGPNALAAPARSVPAAIATAPVEVSEPESVRTPAPSLVSVPAPVPRTPVSVRLPAPPSVSACAPEILPDSVSVPASELMRVAEPSVMAPAMLLTPDRLRSAPPAAMPVPFRVRASAPTAIPPWTCRAAPLATVVPAAVLPSAVAFATVSAPPETVVVPL